MARGYGWQHLAVYINLSTFYFVGVTISILLGFKLRLYAKVTNFTHNVHNVIVEDIQFFDLHFLVDLILMQGLWIGYICGLSSQTGCLLLVALSAKWIKMNQSDYEVKVMPLLV